jgi:hypothetical protein
MVKFLLRRGTPKSLPDDPPWVRRSRGNQARARRNRESANWITNAGRGQMEVPALVLMIPLRTRNRFALRQLSRDLGSGSPHWTISATGCSGDRLASRGSWGSINLQDAREVRRHYIDALKAADNHDIGPLLAFARS